MLNRLRLIAMALVAAVAVAACGVLPGGSGGAAPVQQRGAMPPRETPQQEAQRIKAQREQAQQSGLVAFSAGSGKQTGSLQLLVEPLTAQGRAVWISVDTACRPNCLQRRISIGSGQFLVNSALTIHSIESGRWQLVAARFDGVEKRLSSPPIFEVKKGYATYLGAFVPAVIEDNRNNVLRLLRYSALEQDMTFALSNYPLARGRRIINTVSKLRKPAPMR